MRFLFAILLTALLAPGIVFAQTNQDEDLRQFIGPQPKIIIPGFDGFRPVTKISYGDRVSYQIPYIADYTLAIYRYSLGAAGILSAFFITYGGFLWAIARGDTAKIGAAKKKITGPITGMVVLMSGYVILNTISPSLTDLNAISVTGVPKIELTEYEGDEGTAATTGVLFDKTFDYTKCGGLTTIDGKGFAFGPNAHKSLRTDVAAALIKANQEWSAKNGAMRINRDYRTHEEQQYLYDLYKAGKGAKAAEPGKSNHERGNGVDIATDGLKTKEEYTELLKVMEKNGFAVLGNGTYTSENVPDNWKEINERWHFDYKTGKKEKIVECTK